MSKIIEDENGNVQKRYFRGAFEHKADNEVYADETFEVYKEDKTHNIRYISEILTRMNSGEILKTQVDFTGTQDSTPLRIEVKKYLGQEKVEELYMFMPRNNMLNYTYKSSYETSDHKISTPPKFSIALPSAITSTLFFLSKKFDSTSKNFYSLYFSRNYWTFEEEPKSKIFSMERLSMKTEKYEVNNMEVEGHLYRLSDQSQKFFHPDDKKKNNPLFPHIKIILSKHLAIPYLIEDESKGIQICVKFLNDFTEAFE